MRPVLFLDVDGVLTSNANYAAHPSTGSTRTDPQLDRACVARVNRIVAETGCDVVVTSVLRRQPRARAVLTWLFRDFGATFSVAGVTPGNDGGARGLEIWAWIVSNGHEYPFAILDDSSIDYANGKSVRIPPILLENFVKTQCHIGLTDEQADRAIALLNGPRTASGTAL